MTRQIIFLDLAFPQYSNFFIYWLHWGDKGCSFFESSFFECSSGNWNEARFIL